MLLNDETNGWFGIPLTAKASMCGVPINDYAMDQLNGVENGWFGLPLGGVTAVKLSGVPLNVDRSIQRQSKQRGLHVRWD